MGTMTATIQAERSCAVPENYPVADGRVSFRGAPEAEVVRRAQAGDEGAFAEIVERQQNTVFSVVYRFVRRRIDAEDVAQQVFTKVFFAMKKFDMRSSLSTWIYKIAVNESYDYLRKLKNRRVVYEGDLSEDVDQLVQNSGRTADRSPGADDRSVKRDYLMKLLEYASDEERTLLFLKEVEGRTVDELSAMTGINGNTIKVKLFRARKKLVKASRQLEGLPGSPPDAGSEPDLS